jgi:acetyl esterase
MNAIAKPLSTAVLSLALGNAFAAGSAGVEHQTQKFLEVLGAGDGQPLETLAPKDARAVLAAAQASIKVELPKAEVSQKTITQDGQQVDLTIVRPPGAKG